MAQNKSTAVMQRRREAVDSLDDFPTPPFATRAIIRKVLMPRGLDFSTKTVWEPACNRGYMARPLSEHFATVLTSDIADYGWTGQQAIGDFLGDTFTDFDGQARTFARPDWVFTNPPFNKGDDFVLRALDIAAEGVAVIVRVAFLEGSDRYRDLFSKRMPWIVAQHVERVPMTRGKFDPNDVSATAYAWFIWRKDWTESHYLGTWVPKCRDELERQDDVNYQTRDGVDWVAQSIADSPLFATLKGDA